MGAQDVEPGTPEPTENGDTPESPNPPVSGNETPGVVDEGEPAEEGEQPETEEPPPTTPDLPTTGPGTPTETVGEPWNP